MVEQVEQVEQVSRQVDRVCRERAGKQKQGAKRRKRSMEKSNVTELPLWRPAEPSIPEVRSVIGKPCLRGRFREAD